MTDLIQDTGARGERASTSGEDSDRAGGAPAKTANEQTQGQEAYAGPRKAGESDKFDTAGDLDASTNNAQTPEAGDIDPDSTASSDETGQAGVNDRPGKDKGHPWNG